MKNPAAKTTDHWFDFFAFLGVPLGDMIVVMPDDEESAFLLGTTILDQPWFDPKEIGRGGIFGVTDALRDLRNEQGQNPESDRRWSYACIMIEAMPEPQVVDSNDNYTRILFNLQAIKDNTELSGREGLKVGYHVWPEQATEANT